MNRFEVLITCLAGPVPTAPVVPASELAVLFEADSIVAHARERAQALHDSADAALAQALTDAESLRAQAREQGIADAQVELDAARAALVDETIEWCVAQGQMEAAIAARMDSRIRNLVADALEAFAGRRDGADLLMMRIREAIGRQLANQPVTIYVNDDVLAETIAGCALHRNVVIHADSALAVTQAVLETPLVRVRIDLAQHLQSVLARLAIPSEEEMADGRQDH